MTEKDLLEIRKLMKELKCLDREFQNISSRLKPYATTVKGSTRTFPFIEHVIAVSGIEKTSFDSAVAKTKKKLKDKIDVIMRKIDEADAYIDTIDDVDTRIILRCRYIKNMRWYEIENDMGIPHTTAQRKYGKWKEALT